MPSWMSENMGYNPKQFDDSKGRDRRERSRSRERDDRRDSRRRERSRSRERDSRYSRRDDRDRDRDRKRGRSRSPSRDRYVWKSRKELGRATNFDVRPMPGMEPAPIAVIGGASHSHTHGSSKSTSQFVPPPSRSGDSSTYGPGSRGGVHDRHARRLYVGNLPPSASKEQIIQFLEDTLKMAAPANDPYVGNGLSVVSCMLNPGNTFCFVEFQNMEVTAATLSLDGLQFTCGTEVKNLRMKRPNDFKPDQVSGLGPIPVLNRNVEGIIIKDMTAGGSSDTRSQSGGTGAGKIFIGGLPYNLSDADVEQLLSAFGPDKLKSFKVVRDPGSETSKGYGFAEYTDMATTQMAIDGLNGIDIGNKVLTVKMAGEKSSGQQQQPYPGGMGTGLTQMPPQMGQPPMGMPSGGRGHSMTVPAWMAKDQNPNANMGTALVSDPYALQPPPPTAMNPYAQPSMHVSMPVGVPAAPTIQPTRVLKLSNMVSREEIQDDSEFVDIREDVKEECSGYGQVLSIVIPRAKDGFPYHAEGNIYVEFLSSAMAATALAGLSGRKFADKLVVVEYWNEERFKQQQF